ncbi:MAG TPA: hypothetical protein P5572_18790 [Phycisphaerae bacterium]|nr:hypothetical protein [Phycisphaerae bacterium]
MIPHDEFIMMGVGFVAVGIALAHRRHLARIRHVRLLTTGFGVLLLAWIATGAEHLVLPDLLNLVEHVGYLLGAVLVASWCWLRYRSAEEPS